MINVFDAFCCAFDRTKFEIEIHYAGKAERSCFLVELNIILIYAFFFISPLLTADVTAIGTVFST